LFIAQKIMPILGKMHAHRESTSLPAFITVQPDGVTIAIKVTPRAARNEIGGPMGNELRVKVTAPPVDAAANEALLRLLAETLDCPRGAVQLIRGQTARHKIVKIRGISPAEIMAGLSRAT
jgi:uncharacterized protein